MQPFFCIKSYADRDFERVFRSTPFKELVSRMAGYSIEDVCNLHPQFPVNPVSLNPVRYWISLVWLLLTGKNVSEFKGMSY